MPAKKNEINSSKISYSKFRGNQEIFHGHIFSPESRAYYAWQEGKLDQGQLNQCESGKFFPETQGELREKLDPVNESPNNTPPPDGKIASGNQPGMGVLDDPGTHWKKHLVKGTEALDITWAFTANHVTRRWNYFITKEDWDPSKTLSREQFEAEPFHMVQNNQVPAWKHATEMQPPTPTLHTLILPARIGYHVLLAVWEVADTGNAFYQVIDLDFEESEGGTPGPARPTGLHVVSKTERHVSLTWNPVNASGNPIVAYRIFRYKGTESMSVDIQAPLTSWNDYSVNAATSYEYSVSAVDSEGEISVPSSAVKVTTPEEGSSNNPPEAPKSLHAHGVTTNSIKIMWGSSDFYLQPVSHYLIYRDGVKVGTVSAQGNQVSYDYLDSGLQSNTVYKYYVKAEDVTGNISAASNTISPSTTADGGGNYPDWLLNEKYTVDDKVSHVGKNWKCRQTHTSLVLEWAPDKAESLWERI